MTKPWMTTCEQKQLPAQKWIDYLAFHLETAVSSFQTCQSKFLSYDVFVQIQAPFSLYWKKWRISWIRLATLPGLHSFFSMREMIRVVIEFSKVMHAKCDFVVLSETPAQDHCSSKSCDWFWSMKPCMFFCFLLQIGAWFGFLKYIGELKFSSSYTFWSSSGQ